MKRSIVQHRGSHDRAKLATPGAFNASMNPPKPMLITIIEIWLRNAGSSMPAISDKDETGEKRPSTKSTDRYVRVDRYLAAKAWRLADPESGETNGREKQRDESDGSEITALPPREREVCRIPVNSNHQGWYFQHDTTVYLPDKFTERIKHRYTTSNYNRLTRASLIESLNKKIAGLVLSYVTGSGYSKFV